MAIARTQAATCEVGSCGIECNDDYALVGGTCRQWESQDIGGGFSPSLALDESGIPHVSFSGSPPDYPIQYAVWSGTAWELETVDDENSGLLSLALDSAGNPHIAYIDYDSSELKYAHRNGSTWQVETLPDEDPAWHISLALDSLDYPHIGYIARDYLAGDGTPHRVLRYARWTGSTWDLQTLDGSGAASGSLSLALDGTEEPHFAYSTEEGGGRAVRYKRRSTALEVLDEGTGPSYGDAVSLKVDDSNIPHILYVNGVNDLRYGVKTDSVWEIETVFSDVADECSLALDSLGNPRISFTRWPSDLSYGQWDGAWQTEHVAYGGAPSIALDTTGDPHIAYFGADTVRYVHRTP